MKMKFKLEKHTGDHVYTNPKGTRFVIGRRRGFVNNRNWFIDIENEAADIYINEGHPTKKACMESIDRLVLALPEEVR